MSYEGYTQLLCKSGHWDTMDCWEEFNPKSWKCEVCGEGLAWWNGVNQTNGSWDTEPETGEEIRIDGYIELEVDKEPILKECPTCGHCEIIEERTYKIPESGGCRIQ